MRNIIFRLMQAPGDVLVSTVAIRELHRCYPGQFRIGFISGYPEVTYNNPRIIYYRDIPDAEIIDIDYIEDIYQSNVTGKHFTDGFINNINNKLNLNISKEYIFPEIFLTEEEKNKSILKKFDVEGDFWIFNAGFKNDMPLKAYPPLYWEIIIDKCNKYGIQLIQIGSHNDNHPKFDNVKSLVGKTENLRDYFALCYHSKGGINAVSLQMHVMASFRKSSIVLAGGRENPNWEMYPNHHFLHTIGYFDCCKFGGCWRKQRYECLNMHDNLFYPKCMTEINPNRIVELLLNLQGC